VGISAGMGDVFLRGRVRGHVIVIGASAQQMIFTIPRHG